MLRNVKDVLLDTNLLIDQPDLTKLEPSGEYCLWTSIICYCELLEGEYSKDPNTVAKSVLQWTIARESLGAGIPFDEKEMVSYRALSAATAAAGRRLTRSRRIDLMIAATAHANEMVLATRNPGDFEAIKEPVEIIEL